MKVHLDSSSKKTSFEANPLKSIKKLFTPKIERQVIDTFEKVPKGLTEHKKQVTSSFRYAYRDERLSADSTRIDGSTVGSTGASILSTLM